MGSVGIRYEYHINYDDCDFCNECVEYCSGKALTISNNQIQFQADKCTNCEVCSDVCPVGAIWIETLDYEELSEMTGKRLTKRMEALTNLAHYSTEICLKIPTEFINKDTGENWDFTDKLKENINCLLKDRRNEVIIAKDYWNNNQTVIDIKVMRND